MARVLTARRVRWDEIVADEPYPGITRQILDAERQTLVRYVYQPGSIFPVHAHPEEQITSVLSGRIRFEVAGATLLLCPGEAAIIPADVPHGAAVVGDETVVTLNSLSPRRETHP